MTFATDIQNVLIGFVALFPAINPIGNACALNPYFSGISREEQWLSHCVLLLIYLIDKPLYRKLVLKLFGLSVPLIRLAGRILICKIGWDFLFNNGGYLHKGSIIGSKEAILSRKLFYPISFPMMAGAGTISALFMLGSQSSMAGIWKYLLDSSVIVVSIIGVCITVLLSYSSANTLIHRFSRNNEIIINRIVAFLIFAVGLQIGLSMRFRKDFYMTITLKCRNKALYNKSLSKNRVTITFLSFLRGRSSRQGLHACQRFGHF